MTENTTVTRRLERWFYTDWLRQREERRRRRQEEQQPTAQPADDPYGGAPPPEEPNLLRPTASTPTPRFLSLDNPIVATGALLLLAALASGLTQSH